MIIGCRRTYAQFLLDEGFPSDKVLILMGHATSKTTETNYARPREDRVVKEVLKKWSSENNDEEI
jgi:integrase